MTAWQNRIVGYSDAPVDELLANPNNFRTHPKHQQDALRGILSEVGIVQNIIVNDRTGHLVDGHLRVQLAYQDNQPTVPVTHVDLTEAEEREILATLDPIAALATTDAAKLDELLRDVQTGEAGVQAMLAELAEREGITDRIDPDASSQLGDLEYRIVIECGDEYQQAALLERFEAEGLTCRALMS